MGGTDVKIAFISVFLQAMGQSGVPASLVAVVGSSKGLATTGQAVSALRRLATNEDNAVGMIRVRRMSFRASPRWSMW